jgi:alkanesulfonate monooxygenase SsuD/methylene tetrahydromethanopterin reductase-like flavin-dependent oxidoreductase (luciferase family)
MRDLTFGVGIPTSVSPGAPPVAQAQLAERLGFDFVSSSDHPCGSQPSYETWTMLSWIAARTSRIRVTTRVLGVPYRSPAMVAKMAETLDRLSSGRLILGLGGGYSDQEFSAFGLGVPSPGQKVTGLKEAVTVIRGLWSHSNFSFHGQRYQTEGAELEPKPAHHIPIWLGTFGNRALQVTGQLADGWIPSLGFAPKEALPAMRDRVLTAAAAAGRNPEEVTCALNVEVHVGSRSDLKPDEISGSVEQVISDLHDFVVAGFSAFNFMVSEPDRTDQLKQIAAEVIPALRALG